MNISKNELSKLSEDEIYDFLYTWAETYAPDKKDIYFADKEKMLSILRLYMGVGMKRRRKDLAYAKQIFELISYFFTEEVDSSADDFKMDEAEKKLILNDYLERFSYEANNTAWFDMLKEIADAHGYSSDIKAYKANPENFKGSVSDIAEAVRIAVTGRANTPDLWTIIHIMGEDAMRERIKKQL